MRTVVWGQVSDHSQEPESWNEVDVDDTADKAEVRRQVLLDGSFADPPELRLLSEGGAWRKWENCQTLPPGNLKVKAIYQQSGGRLSYFISPQAQAMVRAAVFYIMDEDNNGVGVGVFFSKSKAVTADHNLTVSQGVGTQVVVQIPGLHEQLTMAVSARDAEMDYAILQSSTDHAYLPVYADPPEQLVGTDLVLAGYRIGIEEYAPMFSRKLGFTKADAITLSNHNNHLLFRCTTFAGDSGAALILKDGCLVGIHQEAVNALRERVQHAKVVKDRLTEVEQSIDALVSGGTAQGCCALLSSVFAK